MKKDLVKIKNVPTSDNNKIKTKSFSREIIKEKGSVNNKIIIDFSFFYFPSINLKYFTNYFKDENSYNNFMLDFYCKTLNYLKDKTYDELEKNTHSHYIKDTFEVKLINKILYEYKQKFSNLPIIDMQMRDGFYQISTLSGARVIGIRYRNIFYTLFFDPYHLIYKDDKFNTDRRAYKNISIYHIRENIKIFNWEYLLENEKCIACEIMEEICK